MENLLSLFIQKGQFDRADGELIQEAWGSALNMALAERQATVPQLLGGKEEAWIADWMEKADRKLQADLSDLESGLWREVLCSYGSEAEEG